MAGHARSAPRTLRLAPAVQPAAPQQPRRPVAVLVGQLGHGGTERQLRLLVQACPSSRWAPHVFVAGTLGMHAEALRASGVPVTLLTGHPLHKLWQFHRAMAALRPLALVSWSSWTNVFALATLGRGVPRVGSFRSAGYGDLPVRGRALWSWASRTGLTTIVCNSPETAEVLRRRARARQRVVFVPNAVEPVADPAGARARWRRELGVADDELLVLGIGRLSPQKGFDRFVDAVARCCARHPVRAVVIGPDITGSAGAVLDAQIRATGLPAGTIRWVGPRDPAREAVCAADVLLLTSREEGMPNVVMEAMAAGVPVVTTPVGGVSSLLADGREGLVAAHDAEALAAALLRLARDPELRRRLGQAGRRRTTSRSLPAAVYGPVWADLERQTDAFRAAARQRAARRTRAADVVLCLASLPVVVPVAAVVAVAVRLSGPGPVLHHAVRVGRSGQPFRLHKFRTMRVGAHTAGPGITCADDPRTTPVGRWLRRSKLDELPQLVNVLRGDMSLVGPRPEDPRYVDLRSPLQQAALRVRPGLTSPASLRFRDEQALLVGPDWERAYRDAVLPAKLALDVAHAAEPGLRSYARVVLDTVVALALPRRWTLAAAPVVGEREPLPPSRSRRP